MRVLDYYNPHHLGDHTYNIHFFRKLIDNYDDIIINYYCLEKYNHELIEQLIGYTDRIILFPLDKKPRHAIMAWIDHNRLHSYYYTHYRKFFFCFDIFHLKFFEHLASVYDLKSPIKTLDDFLFDNPILYKENELSDYKFDILLINSLPMSGQWTYNEHEFDRFIDFYLKQGKKIVTTNKTKHNHENIKCTMDYGLNIMQIGGLAKNCNNVFGIHTSPFLTTINVDSAKTTKNFILLQNQGLTYNSVNCMNIYKNFSDVYDYIDFFPR